jgi:hypothetical protein
VWVSPRFCGSSSSRLAITTFVEDVRYVTPDIYRDYFSRFARAYPQHLGETRKSAHGTLMRIPTSLSEKWESIAVNRNGEWPISTQPPEY